MVDVKAKRIGCIVVLVGTCLLSAGCWDRIEIENKGIVKAIGIDVATTGQTTSAVQQVETFTQSHGTKRIRMSYQVIRLVPPKGGGKSKAETKTFVLSNTGESLFEMVQDTLGQSSKTLNFEHLDVVVISEAAVKAGGLRPFIDYFMRDPEFRWRIKIFITSGEARPILEYPPPTGESGGLYITNIANNQIRNAHVPIGRTDLGYTASTLDNDGDVVLPRLELAGDVLKMGGGAVFKKDKFVGYIDEYAILGLRLMRDLQKSASITIECPTHPGKLIALKMVNINSETKPHVEGEKIYYTVNIRAKGDIEEFQCIAEHGYVNSSIVPELENLFANEIITSIEYGMRTLQILNIDPAGFAGEKLRAHEPETWKKVRDRWGEVYPTIPFIVSSSVTIRNVGEHK